MRQCDTRELPVLPGTRLGPTMTSGRAHLSPITAPCSTTADGWMELEEGQARRADEADATAAAPPPLPLLEAVAGQATGEAWRWACGERRAGGAGAAKPPSVLKATLQGTEDTAAAGERGEAAARVPHALPGQIREEDAIETDRARRM